MAYKSIPMESGWYANLSAGAGTWLDENLKGHWHFFGSAGVVFIDIEKEEDRCLFILKYGNYIA